MTTLPERLLAAAEACESSAKPLRALLREAALALQPSVGGEPVAWRWHHPDGDSGSWQDRDPERERSWRDDEGCAIEYAYLASPAQAA